MKTFSKNIVFPIIILGLVLLFLNNQLANQFSLRADGQIEGMEQNIVVLLMVLSMFIYIFLKHPIIQNKFIRGLLVFSTAIVVSSYVLSFINHGFSFILYLSILVPLLTLLFINSALNVIGEKRIIGIIGLIVALLGAQYYWQYNNARLYLDIDFFIINSSYIILLFLPLILCIDNKIIKYCAVIFIAVLVLSSGKRGGIIALGLSLALFFVFKSISESKKKHNITFVSLLLSLVLLSVVSYFLFDWMDQSYDNILTQRFETMKETGGSDRSTIYETTTQMIVTSDFPSLMIGHGWNGVLRNSPLKCSAHNDYLEVLYDYGLFVFFIFLTTLFYMFKQLSTMVNTQSKYAGHFACAVTQFLVLSMVSHIIIYPSLFMIEMMVFSCLVYFDINDNVDNYENRNTYLSRRL